MTSLGYNYCTAIVGRPPMNIGIIGAGNVGGALTGSATRAGHSVAVSSKGGESAKATADQYGARAASSNRDAVEGADLVILAVPYTAVDDVLSDIGPAIEGTIIVDVTNPLKADYSGLATAEISGAEEIQGKAPGSRVVKAFNTVLAAHQADPRVAGGLRIDGYVAADDEDAKKIVLGLVEAIGLNPVDAGGLAMARWLEGMAWLNINLQMKNGWSWQASWKLVGPEGDAA
jgi:NADPH-dependent F420 reductase